MVQFLNGQSHSISTDHLKTETVFKIQDGQISALSLNGRAVWILNNIQNKTIHLSNRFGQSKYRTRWVF